MAVCGLALADAAGFLGMLVGIGPGGGGARVGFCTFPMVLHQKSFPAPRILLAIPHILLYHNVTV